MITKAEWKALKVGDVLISPVGRERKITKVGSGAISFANTTYLYADLYKKYSVKKIVVPEQVTAEKSKQSKEEMAFGFALRMTGYNLQDKDISLIYQLAILVKAKGELTTLLDIAKAQVKVIEQTK